MTITAYCGPCKTIRPATAISDAAVTLYHAKCEAILPLLPAGSVDVCLTDPP